MYYAASAVIAANHPELAAAVRALDDLLRKNTGHPVRVDFAADILHVKRDLLRRLLGLYEAHGVVQSENAYVCDACDGFLSHVAGEGDLWCDLCEKSVSFRGRELRGERVWRVLVDAATTGWIPPREEGTASRPGTESSRRTTIQFISGDRGGGLQTQVRANREEKEIRRAIQQGTHREQFLFEAIYSASVDDVIACNRHRPGILHFVGHGEERKLLLVRDRDVLAEMQELSAEQLLELLGNYRARVRLVVFNTCLSLGLARHITEQGVVDLAIGVEGRINDDQAVQFAAAFYGQLAEGVTVRQAFGLAAVHFRTGSPAAKPQLLQASPGDAGTVVFAGP
ncbi:MAG: CHAT domain-containing protein [Planctomycetia bacterium]|nr:CHAT domain-containing protein [Planctomycetia bacterium]